MDDFNHSIASLQDSVVEERHHGLNMLGVLSTEGYQVSHLSFYDQTRLFLHQTVASNMLGELGLDRVDTREVEVSSYKNKQTFLYSFAEFMVNNPINTQKYYTSEKKIFLFSEWIYLYLTPTMG